MEICDKKSTTSLQVCKASKKAFFLSEVKSVLYLQERRAQLMDEDCLATPDPTTSTFLYWVKTNRMGTAKIRFLLQCFYIKKTFFLKKTNLYM